MVGVPFILKARGLLELELEVPVVLLPPLIDHLVLPLDHRPPLDEPVHLLELGDAPLSRKKVDLAPFVPVASHLQLPWCALRPLECLLHRLEAHTKYS